MTKVLVPDPADKHIVLLGVGHTNAHVLRMWRTRALPRARLTCVSNQAVATYSGMLPGVLAGQYAPSQMEIDLARLCAAAGAQLLVAEVRGLDLTARRLIFDDRPPLPFDVLSIGIGSQPSFLGVDIVDRSRLVAVKPMQTLLARLDARMRQAAAERDGAPIRVVTVGGGAGGVEVALGLASGLRRRIGADGEIDQRLVSGDARLLPGSLDSTVRRVHRALQRRGVRVLAGHRVTRLDGGRLTLDDESVVDADLIVWAAGAIAPPVLASVGLPTDARGFLLTTDRLQSTSGAPIFAVGDTGTIEGAATAKAGVYAVRQAPILWDNIQRLLAGQALRRYAPQRTFLKLLNTGDGRAIGEWKGLSFEGRWCWRLKDAIDRRFVAKYQDYT